MSVYKVIQYPATLKTQPNSYYIDAATPPDFNRTIAHDGVRCMIFTRVYSVLADHCVPFSLDEYYFEVKILEDCGSRYVG
jgi:hypothetical protein